MTSLPMRNPGRREFQPVKAPLPLDFHCVQRSPRRGSPPPAGVTRPGSFAAVATQSPRACPAYGQSGPASVLEHSKATAAGGQPQAKPPALGQRLLPAAAEAARDPESVSSIAALARPFPRLRPAGRSSHRSPRPSLDPSPGRPPGPSSTGCVRRKFRSPSTCRCASTARNQVESLLRP